MIQQNSGFFGKDGPIVSYGQPVCPVYPPLTKPTFTNKVEVILSFSLEFYRKSKKIVCSRHCSKLYAIFKLCAVT